MRHLALALALTLTACSVESPVEPFRHAALTPGTSLGGAALGRTTLREFLETYGPGHTSLLAGDDFCGLELSFENRQLAFLFEFDAREVYAYENPSIMKAAQDVFAFLEAYPEVGNAELHSLSVNGKMAREDTFYRGGIANRAKLHSNLDAFMGFAEDGFDTHAPSFVAGADERLPELRYTSWQSGFTVYLVEPEEGGTPFVKRITIFAPGPRP